MVPPWPGYAASKAAEWSLTNALRFRLRPQGTLVVGVHVGPVDTDGTAGLDVPKLPRAGGRPDHGRDRPHRARRADSATCRARCARPQELRRHLRPQEVRRR
ncbi:hypothetical protein ACFV5G_01900 [Streptomyces sp. NPDC059766]|uniref:hypothetical protein n=1 Tax=Streptomyces sp. NPDC059766 TaxID=3346940 RepID=UPI003665EBE5